MLKEFKEFISRGNVLDLTVGVIIGGAFQNIVTSLVNNVFTPLLGLILGGVDFSNLSITFRDTKIMYGAFIQSVFDFLIVAFCLFLFIRGVNSLHNLSKLGKKKKEEEVKEEVKSQKSEELVVLEEIRDSLKNVRSK